MDTQTLLKLIGGQAAIARECEISDSAVSQWVENDEIPSARRQYLQLAHPGSHWAEYEKYLSEKRVAEVPDQPEAQAEKPPAAIKSEAPAIEDARGLSRHD